MTDKDKKATELLRLIIESCKNVDNIIKEHNDKKTEIKPHLVTGVGELEINAN